jgi:hypothetical protein
LPHPLKSWNDAPAMAFDHVPISVWIMVSNIRNPKRHSADLKYDPLIGRFTTAAFLYMNYYWLSIF